MPSPRMHRLAARGARDRPFAPSCRRPSSRRARPQAAAGRGPDAGSARMRCRSSRPSRPRTCSSGAACRRRATSWRSELRPAGHGHRRRPPLDPTVQRSREASQADQQRGRATVESGWWSDADPGDAGQLAAQPRRVEGPRDPLTQGGSSATRRDPPRSPGRSAGRRALSASRRPARRPSPEHRLA